MGSISKKSSEKLLGELYYDLKGRKTKRLDWMTIAAKISEAVEMFGSVKNAAEKLSISPSLLNSILRLRKLDQRVQEMVSRREIRLDSAQKLNAVRPKERQYELAKMLVGIPSQKQRELIQRAIQYPQSDLVDYRKRVVADVPRHEKLRIVIIPMREPLYRSIQEASKRSKKSVETIIPEIISEWLEAKGARS